MSCTCHECGVKYKVDFVVDDQLWELIKPDGKEECCGMLCGRCIADKIERFDEYAAYSVRVM